MHVCRSRAVLLVLFAIACGPAGDPSSAANGGSGGGGGSAGAPPPETCGDRVDGDGDGADDYVDPDCAADPAFVAALQGILEDARGPVGALVLGVERADRRVALAASGAVKSGGARAVAPSDRLPIGSATKSFVATVVMQLRDEGALSLDDSLASWLPDFPRAARIRVRHLLGHTSGVFDYTQDDGFADLVLADHRFTPEEMVAIAAAHDPLFEPGAGWSYSNTNYILLGRVIEAVTGHTAAAELRTRILEPLGMADTFLLGSEVETSRSTGTWTRPARTSTSPPTGTAPPRGRPAHWSRRRPTSCASSTGWRPASWSRRKHSRR
jgi:D-alanyl-D-alanine carboxypeptidase